jgi:hypothetical protein
MLSPVALLTVASPMPVLSLVGVPGLMLLLTAVAAGSDASEPELSNGKDSWKRADACDSPATAAATNNSISKCMRASSGISTNRAMMSSGVERDEMA